MKTLFLSIALLFMLMYPQTISANDCDTALVHVQGKIADAFMNSFMTGNTDAFLSIENELSQSSAPWHAYWLAYTYYYKSFYFIALEDKVNSEKEIEKAITLLKKLKDKSSEHYALLGLAQAFSIQFVTGMKAGIISEEANGNANKALELDNKNIRAYYVLGSNDFYTPEEFGGGKEAEKYLLKAIEYPENSSGMACMPSWGKDYTYQMLIELYQKRGNTDLARRYANEGVKLFPENEQIKKEHERLEKL